jgi:dipeptidyl aminopeptidase/acylaminoacyl peptidase
MTRWADRNYFLGGEFDRDVAVFSRDNKQFLVLLRRGNITRNTNEYSLLLFRTNDAFRLLAPQVLLTMSSSSNRDAITQIKWLDDSKTVVFLGENAGQIPEVYSLDIQTKTLKRLTEHATPVVAYDIRSDGRAIIYEALAKRASDKAKIERNGVVITTQDPRKLVACDCGTDQEFEATDTELFVQVAGRLPSRIRSADVLTENLPLSLSPNGRYAVLEVYVNQIPESWAEYQDEHLRPYIIAPRRPGTLSNVRRYMLIDTRRNELTALLDAPVSWFNNGFAWSPDGNSIVVSGVYLPLNVTDPDEHEVRQKGIFVAQIELPSKEIVKITDQNLEVVKWSQATGHVLFKSGDSRNKPPEETYQKTGATWEQVPVTKGDTLTNTPLRVTLEEDDNTPPRVFVADSNGRGKVLLLDLNPQFAHLELGKVEAVSWKATDGHLVTGGLYLPPHYIPGERYPLVIQTHGFRKDRFWIDGPFSSAFAAQPLAAKGMIVLQVGSSSDSTEESRYTDTPQEAPRQMAAYEGAIDYLDRRGLIDRNQVGIIGFSRTVFYVEYTLTHSEYQFSAASLADGFDGGYLNYMLWPSISYANVNGGPPVGPSLSSWVENSPGFLLNRVKTAVHLEYYGPGNFLGGWQWFSGLSLLGKPADYVWLPHGTHLLMKPWERIASLQRNVDWFSFWLKGEEDPDPSKRDQYGRWEQLCALLHPSDQ